MRGKLDLTRKAISMGISLLMLTLSVAVPVLERGELMGEPTAESQHDPSNCAHSHDHRICTLVGANVSLARVTYDHRLAHFVVQMLLPIEGRPFTAETFREGPPSRAPPLT